MAWSPKSPKLRVFPREATPLLFPFCCFRYFVFFGINIKLHPLRKSGIMEHWNIGLTKILWLFLHYSIITLFHDSRIIVGLDFAFFSFFRREDLSLKDPNLHTNNPISGFGLCQAEIDIRPEGVKGYSTLPVPFSAGHFRPSQSSCASNPDPLRAQFECGSHGLLHCPSKSNPSYQLEGHILSYQLGIDLCPLALLDIDKNFFVGHLLEFFFQVLHLRPDRKSTRLNS